MKHLYFWLFIISVTCSISCSLGKKQTLAVEEKTDIEQAANFSSAEIFEGEKKDEVRRIDPNSPPVIIDISGEIAAKELVLADYYPQVRFLKLQHPQKEEGFKIQSGMISFKLAPNVPWPTLSSVLLYKDRILVGNLSGLFCYSSNGEYQHTLLSCDDFKNTDMTKYFNIDVNSVQNLLCGYAVVDDVCSFTSVTNGKATVHFFDLKKGVEIHRKALPMNSFHLLNSTHLTGINYAYDIEAKETKPFMHTITADNDTICSFINQNMLTDMKGMGNYQNPGKPNIYHFNEQLHIRQEGNDTLYRFKSAYEINPAYIFKTGNYNATIQDLIKGNIDNKRSVNQLLETNLFILFSLRGSDNTFYYDKIAKKVHETSRLERNTDMLPIWLDILGGNETSLFGVYTPHILSQLAVKDYSSEELAVIKKWNEELKEGEILLMILEE